MADITKKGLPLTPIDKYIRKIRKMLRQIDRLEVLDRELKEEEIFKVNRKAELRDELQKLLQEHRPDEVDVMKRPGGQLKDEPQDKKTKLKEEPQDKKSKINEPLQPPESLVKEEEEKGEWESSNNHDEAKQPTPQMNKTADLCNEVQKLLQEQHPDEADGMKFPGGLLKEEPQDKKTNSNEVEDTKDGNDDSSILEESQETETEKSMSKAEVK